MHPFKGKISHPQTWNMYARLCHSPSHALRLCTRRCARMVITSLATAMTRFATSARGSHFFGDLHNVSSRPQVVANLTQPIRRHALIHAMNKQNKNTTATATGFTFAALQKAIANLPTKTPAEAHDRTKLKGFATNDGKMINLAVNTREEINAVYEMMSTPRKATKLCVANVTSEGKPAYKYDKTTKERIAREGREATHYCALASFASKVNVCPTEKKQANSMCAPSKRMEARNAAREEAARKKSRKAKIVSIGTKVAQAAAVAAITALTAIVARKA